MNVLRYSHFIFGISIYLMIILMSI